VKQGLLLHLVFADAHCFLGCDCQLFHSRQRKNSNFGQASVLISHYHQGIITKELQMTDAAARLTQVLQLLEQQLDTDLNLDSLSAEVGLSKYHFHRWCSLCFGMPVMTLLRQLRLKRAAYQLVYRPQLSIIDIALQAGFDSHAGFSRAFRRTFAQNPSNFRQHPDWHYWQTQQQKVRQLRTDLMDNASQYQVEIVEVPALPLAVMSHRGAPQLLGQTIRHFIAWRRANQLPPDRSRTFNLLYDDPSQVSADEHRFDLACSLAHWPADRPLPATTAEAPAVFRLTLAAGRCARLRHYGSDDQIGQAVQYLYQQWLAQSGQQLGDFPLFFERVKFFPDVSESEMITDIYLPLRGE
jgi:AraC family transcriptional regulator